MSTIINGDSPSITFSDGSTQSKGISSVNPVFTGDASISGLTVGKGGGAVAGNTAVGYQAGYSNTTSQYSAYFGYQAGYASTGEQNTAVGGYTMIANTTGLRNTAVGTNTLYTNTTGSYNTALGNGALALNTTASYNTAVGYQAGYTNSTGTRCTFLGMQSAYLATTGTDNTFVGYASGYNMTTGSKNTILGGYSGNNGGLDIRTASNNIVLSDGDGNPKFYTLPGQDGQWILNSASSSSNPSLYWARAASTKWVMWNNNLNDNIYIQNGSFTNGVTMNTSSTSWSSASDSRLKNVTGTYENALADISQIEPIKFTWKSDTENKPQVGVIAQSVQKVVPEAVDLIALSQNDDTEYLTVRYTELIPLMIASIQELKAELDATKAEVAALKAAA